MARKPARKTPAKKKVVAKKATAKKKAATKTTAKTAAAPARNTSAIKAKMTKTAILKEIAANTGLNTKQIGSVLDELEVLIERHVKKRAVGEFTLPGLLKVKSVKRPATKKRVGRNPATGDDLILRERRVVTFKCSGKLRKKINGHF